MKLKFVLHNFYELNLNTHVFVGIKIQVFFSCINVCIVEDYFIPKEIKISFWHSVRAQNILLVGSHLL